MTTESVRDQLEAMPLPHKVFILVVGIPFLLFGLYALGRAVRLISERNEARTWLPTPCTVLSLKLEDDGEACTTHCRYSYEFDGRRYGSDRLALDSELEGNEWHRARYTEFQEAGKAREQVFCYVNPHDPSEAMLFRELRLGVLAKALYFGLVFIGIGVLMITAGCYGIWAAQRARALCRRYANQPWLARDDWRAGIVYPRNRGRLLGLWVAAVFWNVISAPFAVYVFPAEIRDGKYWVVAMYIAPALGLLILWVAVSRTARWRRFARSFLSLRAVPIRIGESLSATLTLRGRMGCLRDVQATLTAGHIVRSGEQLDLCPYWKETHRLGDFDVPFGTDSIDLAILFTIPQKLRRRLEPKHADSITWHLSITGKVADRDLDLVFQVPVFGSV